VKELSSYYILIGLNEENPEEIYLSIEEEEN